MRIKLNHDLIERYEGSIVGRAQFCIENAGKWVAVKSDDINLRYGAFMTVGGLIIPERDVSEVEDDTRLGKAKCDNCGHVQPSGHPCRQCEASIENVIEFVPRSAMQCNDINDVATRLLSEVYGVV